jgi:hypothetical protein
MLAAVITTADRHREAITGLERRVERDERNGEDTTIARIILMQHYAAYAVSVIQGTGGNLTELHTLTDRNNVVPLAAATGLCPAID